jgi:hypothetical protein
MSPAPTSISTLTAGSNGTVKKTTEAPSKMNGLSSNGKLRSNGSIKSTLISNEDPDIIHAKESYSVEDDRLQIVWRNVILFIYLHGAAVYGGYLWLSGEVMWQTFLWGKRKHASSIFITRYRKLS